ncbi:intracellular protein transporter USO1-like protein [Perilla frutescens var. frutescens]|nr:intracellular protein transporter USO1-like protein [Perilla frutescens var. frutescens]
MHHGGGAPLPRLRRLHHDHLYKDKTGLEPLDPSPASLDQPGSSSSLRSHAAASLMKHHRSTERNSRALQPVSPASYGSSMEEDCGHLESRIYEIGNELKVVVNWITGNNAEKDELKKEIVSLLQQLEEGGRVGKER